MIEIEVKGDDDPRALAALIAATLHGEVLVDPGAPEATAGKLVRERQEAAERARPARDQLETVNFRLLDDDLDWSEL